MLYSKQIINKLNPWTNKLNQAEEQILLLSNAERSNQNTNYKDNNRGPKIEPCGTPNNSGTIEESDPEKLTHIVKMRTRSVQNH